MKKSIILLFSFLFIWWLCNADLAWYWIDSYTSNFKLRDDWILEVTENINVNFSESRHWIYRTIPYIYSNYLKTPIKKVKVPWYKFTTNKQWNNYEIKIWSANKTVIWKQNYNIQYQIKWSIREFSGYQELYRNMLWTERNTPVNNFNFSLELPSDLNLNDSDIRVYIWEKWSNNTIKAIKSWNIIKNAEPLNLWARQWVTLAVKLPTNYVPTKKHYSLKWWFIYHSKIISIWIRSFITALIGYFSIRELIKRYRRRKELIQTHWRKIRDIIYYTPPKWYSAMDVAAIYNWKSNFNVFSAFLYSWIADKYVHIEEVKVKKLLWLYYKKEYHFIPDSPQNFKFDEWYEKCENLRFNNPEKRFWNLCFIDWDINKLYKFDESDSNLLKEIADEVFFKIHTKFIPNWRDLYKVKRLSSYKYKSSYNYKNSNLKFFDLKFYKKIYGENYQDWKYILNWFVFILWGIGSLYLVISFSNNEDSSAYFAISLAWFFILFSLYKFFNSVIIDKLSFKTRWYTGKDTKYISEEWIEVIEKTLWFRKYLLAVDDEKLRSLLKEDPTYFEKNLPYAIALDVWDHWIKKCIHILEEMNYSPKWISVSDNNRWNAITSLSSIWNSISSTVYDIDHPSSSGWDWWGDRWSSSGWSSGGWSSGWWGGWGWWWSW